MTYETVLYEAAGGVAVITLNRPDRLNAFTRQMHADLRAALQAAAGDPAVRTVVLTGAGRAFCAGQDLEEIGQGPVGDLVRDQYNPLILAIRRLAKPVLAAVNGVAAGAGMSLALACDLRIASERASFTTAFARVGLVADSGMSFFLPRLVGSGKAAELLFLSERVDAQQALALGLVNRVAPESEFAAAWREWAERLARGPAALGYMKQLLARSAHATLEEQLEHEAWFQGLAAGSADGQEGVRAFVEKREPRFRGQ